MPQTPTCVATSPVSLFPPHPRPTSPPPPSSRPISSLAFVAASRIPARLRRRLPLPAPSPRWPSSLPPASPPDFVAASLFPPHLAMAFVRFLFDEPPPPPSVHSDVVLVLVFVMVGLALLAGVAGLAMLSRRAWLWLRRSSTTEGLPNGLKREDLLALPKLSYEGAVAIAGERLADCAICLAEFEEGNEIRLLPPCGHSFHIDCVDRWLSSHASCLSCQWIVVVSAASSVIDV